ncbi:hypothetical protein [Pseudonocardia kunmingensis]|uniref:hypothetical protein n=1 Tax=Pseudonocardia kunmingensis TaxID=630975 RepID=UPI00114E98CC|nr:hypothetical protein [Pseudonocardia kunmingensis]
MAVTAAGSPASVTANPNPIDWTIVTTFQGPNGEDLPLRRGHRDVAGLRGFGEAHIQGNHGGHVPDYSIVQAVLDSCRPPPHKQDETVTCSGSGIRVAYTEREDLRNSFDDRPVGIITAFVE